MNHRDHRESTTAFKLSLTLYVDIVVIDLMQVEVAVQTGYLHHHADASCCTRSGFPVSGYRNPEDVCRLSYGAASSATPLYVLDRFYPVSLE